MLMMYYKLLKTALINFLQDKDIHLDNNEILKAKPAVFKTIVYPSKWLWLNINLFDDELGLRHLLVSLSSVGLPFLAIVKKDGIYFADIAKGYNALTKNIELYKNLSFWSEKINLGDEILLCNYTVFTDKSITLRENIQLDLKNLYEMPPGVDFIVKLFLAWVPRYQANVVFVAEIKPSGFVLNGLYLTHKIYDASDVLTTRFLKEIIPVFAEAAEVFNSEIFLSSTGIKNKSELIDQFENEIIKPKCKELWGINYEPGTQADENLRLENIKRFFKMLKSRFWVKI